MQKRSMTYCENIFLRIGSVAEGFSNCKWEKVDKIDRFVYNDRGD